MNLPRGGTKESSPCEPIISSHPTKLTAAPLHVLPTSWSAPQFLGFVCFALVYTCANIKRTISHSIASYMRSKKEFMVQLVIIIWDFLKHHKIKTETHLKNEDLHGKSHW